MPLYVADYLADTRRLSTLEHGAYLLLIMEYWQSGGLPDDDDELAQIAGLTLKEWGKIRGKVARLFLPGWRHKRVDEELAKASSLSDRRRASAERRWSKGDANADAIASAKAHASDDASGYATPMQRRYDCDAKDMHRAGVPQPQPQPQPHTEQLSKIPEPPARPTQRSRAELDRIEAVLREAAGVVDSPNAPGKFSDLSEILGFLDAGVSLEETILPVLKAKKTRGHKAFSWGFFVPAIRDAIEKRAASQGVARAMEALSEHKIEIWCGVEMPEGNLIHCIERWRKNPASWLQNVWGPPPDESAIIRKFAAERGIDLGKVEDAA